MRIKWFDVGEQAVGVIALGQFATGVLAIGQVATGVVAVGQLARGVFVLGQLGYGAAVVAQLGASVGIVGGMLGVGARRWFGWTVGLIPSSRPHPEPSQHWSVWRAAGLVALAVGFYVVVALPVYQGLLGEGGALNQRLR